MGIYYKDIDFNSDLLWLRDNIRTVFTELGAAKVDFGYSLRSVQNNNKLVEIKEKYELSNHCYILISNPEKLTHDPHHHGAENVSITLLTPISGCDNRTVTSFVEPIGEHTNATDSRTSTVLHPNCEYKVIEHFILKDNPVLLNNSQWHMIESETDVVERVSFAWPFANHIENFDETGFTW